MKVTDEMVEAALRGWDKSYALDAEENKNSSEIPDVKVFMRAALEAALGQQKGKKYSAADNLRNWAKAKATEDNDYLRADLLSSASCIEELAEALKKIESYEFTFPYSVNAQAHARATLERWGLK